MNKLSADQQNIIAICKSLSGLLVKTLETDAGGKQANAEGKQAIELGFQLFSNMLIDLNRSANALEVLATAVSPLAAMAAAGKSGKIIKP